MANQSSTEMSRSAAHERRAHATFDTTPRGRAGGELALSLDELYFAQRRFQFRGAVFGMHGEDYERRWARVRDIVMAHDYRMVQRAREAAVQAGWSQTELRSSGLDTPE